MYLKIDLFIQFLQLSICTVYYMSRSSIFVIVIGYRLDDRRIGARVPIG
jgi:hypothetical protein